MSTKPQRIIPLSAGRRLATDDLLAVPHGESVPVVTQGQLAHVLTLREEIEMIREEIKNIELEVGMSLRMNARVEAGPHMAFLDNRKRVKIAAFRGGIIR